MISSKISVTPWILPQAIGMLEGQQHTLEDAVRELEKQKVDKIIVVPVLLFPATHAREDIPQRMQACAGVPFEICETLGTTKAVYDWLKDRLQEAAETHPTFPIMLVAHGTTHYPEPGEQLERIAAALRSDLGRDVFAYESSGGTALSGDFRENSPTLCQAAVLYRWLLGKKNRFLVRKKPASGCVAGTVA